MLRELTAIVALAAAGGLALSSCQAGCDDCCDDVDCSGGGSVSACSATGCGCGGSACGTHCPIDSPPVICNSGGTQDCVTAKKPLTPSCAGGQHTCNGDGTGFGICSDVRPHPDACDQPSSFTCDGDAPACGTPNWATMLGGPDEDEVVSIVVDTDDTIVASLSTHGGKVRFGNVEKSVAAGVVVVKLDANGAPIWETVLANATSAMLALDPEHHVFLTGMFGAKPLVIDGDRAHELTVASGFGVFAARLEANGKAAWSVSLTGSGANTPGRMEASAIEVIDDGDVMIVGTYSGADVLVSGDPLPTSKSLDAFLTILKPANGELVRARGFAVPGTDNIRAIAKSGDDFVFGGVSFGALACPDERLFYEGVSEKSDSISWTRNPEMPLRIQALGGDDEGIVATGIASGPFSALGNTLSTPGFVLATQAKEIDWIMPLAWNGAAISLDEHGQITVVGADSQLQHAAIAKFDRQANRFYEHLYEARPGTTGGTASIAFNAIGRTKARGVIVGGSLRGQTDLGLGFGGLPITSSGKTDGFVASFAP